MEEEVSGHGAPLKVQPPIVVTEICPETGSWLNDAVLDKRHAAFQSALAQHLERRRPVHRGGHFHRLLIEATRLRNLDLIVRRQSQIEAAVSYKLHTNRELRLMLDGKKDFSVFTKHRDERLFHTGGQSFTNFRSRIKRRQIRLDQIDYVFYFKYRSAWKIESYIVLKECVCHLGASRQTEFIEGVLLGYTPKEIDEYLTKFWDQLSPK